MQLHHQPYKEQLDDFMHSAERMLKVFPQGSFLFVTAMNLRDSAIILFKQVPLTPSMVSSFNVAIKRINDEAVAQYGVAYWTDVDGITLNTKVLNIIQAGETFIAKYNPNDHIEVENLVQRFQYDGEAPLPAPIKIHSPTGTAEIQFFTDTYSTNPKYNVPYQCPEQKAGLEIECTDFNGLHNIKGSVDDVNKVMEAAKLVDGYGSVPRHTATYDVSNGVNLPVRGELRWTKVSPTETELSKPVSEPLFKSKFFSDVTNIDTSNMKVETTGFLKQVGEKIVAENLPRWGLGETATYSATTNATCPISRRTNVEPCTVTQQGTVNAKNPVDTITTVAVTVGAAITGIVAGIAYCAKKMFWNQSTANDQQLENLPLLSKQAEVENKNSVQNKV